MQKYFTNTFQNTLFYNTIPVLKYHISFPCFTTTCNACAARQINHFYILLAKQLEHYCMNTLYQQAAEAASYISQNEPPFFCYEFSSDYTVTQNIGAITSLYFDQYEYMGGAHGSTKRTAYTWDFCTGSAMHLAQFFPCDCEIAEVLFQEIEQQAEVILKESPSVLFPDYSTLIRENFHPGQFYLKDNHIVIFYQQYDIAPYVTGIPEFYMNC